MSCTLRRFRFGEILLVLTSLALGCYPNPTVQPRWIELLLPKLRCGMKPEEIQALTAKEVVHLGAGHWFFGNYRIDTSSHHVWLRIDEHGLQAVAWAAAVDLKNSRISPRHNLCTDKLSFLVDVSWTTDFVGSDVFLDGTRIAENADVCPPLELSTAHHELRIESPEHAPTVQHFDLTADDPGFQLLYVSTEEICIRSPSSRPADRSSQCRANVLPAMETEP